MCAYRCQVDHMTHHSRYPKYTAAPSFKCNLTKLFDKPLSAFQLHDANSIANVYAFRENADIFLILCQRRNSFCGCDLRLLQMATWSAGSSQFRYRAMKLSRQHNISMFVVHWNQFSWISSVARTRSTRSARFKKIARSQYLSWLITIW